MSIFYYSFREIEKILNDNSYEKFYDSFHNYIGSNKFRVRRMKKKKKERKIIYESKKKCYC